MKKIVFINQDSGYLMIDIINSYAEAGYTCVLVTGRLVTRNISLNSKVKIEKIIRYRRETTFWRLFTWIFGFFQIIIKVSIRYRNDYLFIVTNPPFNTFLPLWVKNKFQLLIFDIYPDTLTELGYLSANSLLIKWWSKSNAVVFGKARRIFTITDGMKQVLKKYAVNSEIEVVPVWTDNTFFKSLDSMDNPFLKKYNLLGKFVVLYSGNIGISGDVDILIDVANEVKNENIIFLIIGEGAKKKIIEERVMKFGLNNVIMLPWQPVSELPYSLSSASLAVISLGIKSSKLSIPSKLYNFLSVGAPILCISSKGSEVESLVSKYKCGRNFEPGEISGIVNFIVEVAENYQLHDFMRNNSLKASKDFSSKNVVKFLHFGSSDFN